MVEFHMLFESEYPSPLLIDSFFTVNHRRARTWICPRYIRYVRCGTMLLVHYSESTTHLSRRWCSLNHPLELFVATSYIRKPTYTSSPVSQSLYVVLSWEQESKSFVQSINPRPAANATNISLMFLALAANGEIIASKILSGLVLATPMYRLSSF